ncbi:helix-turn-helix transcriptional regulator [Rubellimicrobium roseum]|uniref:helix-turn-helix transcriptional regulator n=1 Tax=Rubellimicrobium roseum TaxID=687525 RepID=UPI001FEB5907|nr:helix-turn-helix transcriptional regulator [Rubellimicrobium roseum]
MTGAELRAHRRAAGLSQEELARRAGVTRDTVHYWEAKPRVNLHQMAPRRFVEVLGLGGLCDAIARAGMGSYSGQPHPRLHCNAHGGRQAAHHL